MSDNPYADLVAQELVDAYRDEDQRADILTAALDNLANGEDRVHLIGAVLGVLLSTLDNVADVIATANAQLASMNQTTRQATR